MSNSIGTGIVGLVTQSKSASFRRLNAHLLAPRPDGPIKCQPLEAPKKRLRQSSKPVLNELESRFLAKLNSDHPGSPVLSQAVRLELARGIWYRPDHFMPYFYSPGGGPGSKPTFFECKGPKVFRGGLENLKVAARVHAWARFYLVWEENDVAGAWREQEVLP